ncbi:unnamed protein product [Pedinophyceae sp. YPF-701]|nr:unnamed protein product [Pedinophyceae sp. YPF-701]
MPSHAPAPSAAHAGAPPVKELRRSLRLSAARQAFACVLAWCALLFGLPGTATAYTARDMDASVRDHRPMRGHRFLYAPHPVEDAGAREGDDRSGKENLVIYCWFSRISATRGEREEANGIMQRARNSVEQGIGVYVDVPSAFVYDPRHHDQPLFSVMLHTAAHHTLWFLKRLPSNTLAAVVDCGDVTFIRNATETLKRFHDFDADIVVGSQNTQWPDNDTALYEQTQKLFANGGAPGMPVHSMPRATPTKAPFKFLNTGVIVGYARAMEFMWERLVADDEFLMRGQVVDGVRTVRSDPTAIDDQRGIRNFWLLHYDWIGKGAPGDAWSEERAREGRDAARRGGGLAQGYRRLIRVDAWAELAANMDPTNDNMGRNPPNSRGGCLFPRFSDMDCWRKEPPHSPHEATPWPELRCRSRALGNHPVAVHGPGFGKEIWRSVAAKLGYAPVHWAREMADMCGRRLQLVARNGHMLLSAELRNTVLRCKLQGEKCQNYDKEDVRPLVAVPQLEPKLWRGFVGEWEWQDRPEGAGIEVPRWATEEPFAYECCAPPET